MEIVRETLMPFIVGIGLVYVGCLLVMLVQYLQQRRRDAWRNSRVAPKENIKW